MIPELVRRQAAAQAVWDRYDGQPLDYRRFDCGRMAAMSLKLLGWKPRWSRFTGYSSELGARRKLLKAGFQDLPAVLDNLGLPRVEAVKALPADILGFPNADDWTALGVAMGNGNTLAGAPDLVFRVAKLPPDVLQHALCWRVTPKGRL